MAFQIIWTETAAEDLKEITGFIAFDDAKAAANLADRIFKRMEHAAEFPLSNRIVPEKEDIYFREALLNPYRIVYYVDKTRTAIYVLRIWHASRGTPEIDPM